MPREQYGSLPYIKQYLSQVQPKRLLEMSMDYGVYGAMCKDTLKHLKQGEEIIIDRVVLEPCERLKTGVYRTMYNEKCLSNSGLLTDYEMVLWVEDLGRYDEVQLVEKIQLIHEHITECLLIVNIKDYDTMSKVQPILLRHYDFTYYSAKEGRMTYEFYALYPHMKRETMAIDESVGEYLLGVGECPRRKLKVGYLLPHGNLTGGMKCLLEQMRQLQKKGHQVTAYRRCKENESVIPPWSDLQEGQDIEKAVTIDEKGALTEYLAEELDVVVVGWMMQLPEFEKFDRPIMLWEQGSEYLYGDYKQLMAQSHPLLAYLRSVYGLPVRICSVSTTVQEILWHKYRRKSWLLPNGIDTKVYYPQVDKVPGRNILLIGNPYLAFKGFDVAIKILDLLWARGCEFQVTWVCQMKKAYGVKPYTITYHVLPSQEDLARHCREADVFLSTSVYESFPMPPIEAMASGLPVVTTDCGGIRTYGRDGYNAMICEQGDLVAIVDALELLIEDVEKRIEMGSNGRKTALAYDFAKIVEKVEDCLYDLSL